MSPSRSVPSRPEPATGARPAARSPWRRRARLAAALALAGGLAGSGCDEPAEGSLDLGADADLGTSDAGTDADNDAEPDEALPVARSYTSLVSDFRFAREEPVGVSPGFDLDGHESRGSDAEGCRKPDLTSPDGETGIDNQFARLMPTIESVGGASIEGLSLEAINDGRLLITITLDGVEDLQNDDDVSVTISRGAGAPLVGNDGRLEPGQTVELSTDYEQSRVEGVSIVDGVATAGPFALSLELQVFQFVISFYTEDAFVHLETHEDGSVAGFLSMGLPVEQIVAIASLPGTGTVGELIATSAPLFADLRGESGECDAISVTALIETVPAFLFVTDDEE